MFRNLIYKSHRVIFYIYSVKYYYQDNKNKNKLKTFIKSIIKNLKIFNYKYGYYEYLEIPITTKCNLNCQSCANLIPCYKKQSDYEITNIIKSLKKFLKCINNIVYIRILGGEPFISKNLYPILKFLLKSNKIQRIEIVTNGSIIPTSNKLVNLLKNPKVIINISRYPNVNYNKLINFLEQNKINYKLNKINFWMSYGQPFKRNKTQKQLIKQYKTCSNVCKSLINGQLHLCPRSSHGTDLGIIKNNKNDYLDLLNENISDKELKKELTNLFKKKYIQACDYCDFGTDKCKKIPVAKQRNKKSQYLKK